MKTFLFRNKETNEVLTFLEVKQALEEKLDAEIEIPDSDVRGMIRDNTAGVEEICDESLNWCNDFAEITEADRYLGQSERDESIKVIYETIVAKDAGVLDSVKEILDWPDGAKLLKRLNELCKEVS